MFKSKEKMNWMLQVGNAGVIFYELPDFYDKEIRRPSYFEGGVGYPGRWCPGAISHYERRKVIETGKIVKSHVNGMEFKELKLGDLIETIEK